MVKPGPHRRCGGRANPPLSTTTTTGSGIELKKNRTQKNVKRLTIVKRELFTHCFFIHQKNFHSRPTLSDHLGNVILNC